MSQHKENLIKKNVSKNVDGESSPMDPPDAFDPPHVEKVPRQEMSPFLQKLMDDHEAFTSDLRMFEELLTSISENGITKEHNEGLRRFFHQFDNDVIAHQQIEEKELFPALDKALLKMGEHSQGREVFTSVDLMQGDHLKSVQLAAVAFNFFGLSSRLPDVNSRLVALDLALEQGKALVEMLRLHMFREDNIIFPLAHLYIDQKK